ncbi:MAG: ATP-binding protein [Ruminiclostridium sp.]|nr:ATP-binding protein [Ruminiclostridium sp.]
MKRILIDKLLEWKASSRRKPLILKGIRQVGKTWILKEFASMAYEDAAYFNFEGNAALAERFKKNLDPRRLILELGVINGKTIHPGKTLIIFDEIQFCSDALTSLKYFCETANEYHIVCAGSLLGIALARPTSYPVGKVDILTLRPMSFYEFLLANNEDMLTDYLDKNINIKEPIGQIFVDKLESYLKTYYITGGMPEAVSVWLQTKDVNAVENVQQNILTLYELDFSKHAPTADIPKLSMIWNSIPNQLAKESGKFIYGLLKEGAGARAFENAMAWLQNAGMVYKIHKIEKPSIPLKAYVNNSHFKVYCPDVGLLRKMSGLSAKSIIEEDRLFQEFKGAMAENYVLQELIMLLEDVPFYWTSGNTAEIDFVAQFVDKIIPIEVKSSTNIRSKSMRVYREKYTPPLVVKATLFNLCLNEGVLNIPLYLLWKLSALI